MSSAASPMAVAAWKLNRALAATARDIKGSLDRWRAWTLILAIAGASSSPLGELLRNFQLERMAKGAGVAGAAAVALASYFAREALSGDRVQSWTKARSAAEALKASMYLYRAGVPPFDGADRDAKLLERKAQIESGLEGIEAEEQTSLTETPDLSPLTVTDYIKQRVEDQIGFYRERVNEYQKRVGRLRFLLLWLGALGVLFGIGAARGSLGSWAAVIGTVTASVTAHIQSQRYQNVIVVYRTTERRLQFLKEKWETGGKTEADKSERNTLIQSCEDAITLENGSWLAQWSHQKQAQTSQQSA